MSTKGEILIGFELCERIGSLLVAGIYLPEDYRRIFGADMDSYKDYLLEREKYIDDVWREDAVKVLHVPFDGESYREWLEKSACFRDGPEARTAWVVDAATDGRKLSELLEKHPLIPRAPFEEETEVSVIFLAVPATVRSPEDVLAFTDRFSVAEITEIYHACLAYFDTESFQQISRLRSKGMKVILADGLIMSDRAFDCAAYYRNVALGVEGAVPVPRALRPDGSDVKRLSLLAKKFNPAPVLGLYPLVLVGCSRDVAYCEWLLAGEKCSTPVVLFETILWDRMPDNIAGVQVVHESAVGNYLDEIADDLGKKLGPEGEAVIYPNRRLWRIK